MIAKVAFLTKVRRRSSSPGASNSFPRRLIKTLALVSMIVGSKKAAGRLEGETFCYFSLMIGWSGCAGFGISR